MLTGVCRIASVFSRSNARALPAGKQAANSSRDRSASALIRGPPGRVVITMKSHGCENPTDGARWAAASTRSSTSARDRVREEVAAHIAPLLDRPGRPPRADRREMHSCRGTSLAAYPQSPSVVSPGGGRALGPAPPHPLSHSGPSWARGREVPRSAAGVKGGHGHGRAALLRHVADRRQAGGPQRVLGLGRADESDGQADHERPARPAG